jgi:DNA-binding transcriptional LysR family regulator
MTLREEHPVAPLFEHLRHDDYDAAIIGMAQPEPPDGLRGELISAEPLVLLAAPDHRLGHVRFAPVTQRRDEPLVTLTRGSALRTHLDHACDAAGLPAGVTLETSDIDLLGDLVARGLGATIVPRSIAEAAAARHPLRIIGIRPAITQRYTFLCGTRNVTTPPRSRPFSPTPELGLPRANPEPSAPHLPRRCRRPSLNGTSNGTANSVSRRFTRLACPDHRPRVLGPARQRRPRRTG